jgi:hypothetical protein
MISRFTKGKKYESEEIKFIDRCVVKIAHLMAIGYGEAGTDIIVRNMNLNGSQSI